MGVRIENVGRWYPDRELVLTPEAIERYADATNDANPAYRKGEDSIAPPLFGFVSGWPAVLDCVADTLTDDLLVKVVHQAQDMRFARPARAGEAIVSRARVASVRGGPRAMTLVAQVESRDAAGDPIVDFRATIYVREGGQPSAGDDPPKLTPEIAGDVIASVDHEIDLDQAVRYADASGDHNPIHLDDAAAQAVGFPGTILHGMCTLAFACRAAVERLGGGDPSRLRRFGGRFTRYVSPGQRLTTSFRPAVGGGYGFECETGGTVVVRDGVVELS